MKCSRFFGGHFLWTFFGQVWGISDKTPSHPQKFACSYTYASGRVISIVITEVGKYRMRWLSWYTVFVDEDSNDQNKPMGSTPL